MAGEIVITVVGNLTADPELRWIGDGTAVASFTIASTPRSYDRNTNSFKDGETVFMRCSAWREMGENVAESLKKGMRVVAQGRLMQRSWESQKSGERHTSMELSVDEIGPSLRYAKAHVERNARRDGGNYGAGNPTGSYDSGSAGGGYTPPQPSYGQPAGGGADDPWNNSAGGFQGAPDNSTFNQEPPF